MSHHSVGPHRDCHPKPSSQILFPVHPMLDPPISITPIGEPLLHSELPIRQLEQLWDEKDLHSIQL